MQKEELQKFCVEKNVLLDSSLQEVFILFPEEEFIKNLIEKIKIITNKRFLNKSLIKANQNSILKFVDYFPFSKEVFSIARSFLWGLVVIKQQILSCILFTFLLDIINAGLFLEIVKSE